jgi:hypothetical protein
MLYHYLEIYFRENEKIIISQEGVSMKQVVVSFNSIWEDKRARLVFLSWLITSCALLGSVALAGPFQPIVQVFCDVYTAFNTTGRFIIVFFGIVSIGVGLWLRRSQEVPRVAWTMIGMGFIVGAGTLVTTLFGAGITASCA